MTKQRTLSIRKAMYAFHNGEYGSQYYLVDNECSSIRVDDAVDNMMFDSLSDAESYAASINCAVAHDEDRYVTFMIE